MSWTLFWQILILMVVGGIVVQAWLDKIMLGRAYSSWVAKGKDAPLWPEPKS